MAASAGEILMAIYRNTQTIIDKLGGMDGDAILKAVNNYPVPGVTEKQIVTMLNRKYPIEYIAAVSGLSISDVKKKYNSFCEKHS